MLRDGAAFAAGEVARSAAKNACAAASSRNASTTSRRLPCPLGSEAENRRSTVSAVFAARTRAAFVSIVFAKPITRVAAQ
ncbi:hypothetical protein VT84_16885 [Gemmata sp. SH-PL17]|nr:hypothetical protein VT84_16885 [Gemmata sp. SH-PL17]